MKDVLVTGSAGLIGSEAVRFFCERGYRTVGVDNHMRAVFFGKDADTRWNNELLLQQYESYVHHNIDIRDFEALSGLFQRYDFDLVIHTAAQPSHDWAARDPFTDFTVNANGTLSLLESCRLHCPEAVFIFTSTNKVYGDLPNQLPLVELENRYEIEGSHPWFGGIDETMPIDQCMHSLFGASKVAADILVQEYGRYFHLKTGVFRGGCLTGPAHSGTRLHGFLSYLMRCCITETPYTIFGYGGKQVRDNIHSFDLINAFYHFYRNPRPGEVYNMGGGRRCNCSVLEAIALCREISEKKLQYGYIEQNRAGDHIWWISDVDKFRAHYPGWDLTYDLPGILEEIYQMQKVVCAA